MAYIINRIIFMSFFIIFSHVQTSELKSLKRKRSSEGMHHHEKNKLLPCLICLSESFTKSEDERISETKLSRITFSNEDERYEHIIINHRQYPNFPVEKLNNNEHEKFNIFFNNAIYEDIIYDRPVKKLDHNKYEKYEKLGLVACLGIHCSLKNFENEIFDTDGYSKHLREEHVSKPYASRDMKPCEAKKFFSKNIRRLNGPCYYCFDNKLQEKLDKNLPLKLTLAEYETVSFKDQASREKHNQDCHYSQGHFSPTPKSQRRGQSSRTDRDVTLLTTCVAQCELIGNRIGGHLKRHIIRQHLQFE